MEVMEEFLVLDAWVVEENREQREGGESLV
jgi:hypothetical protein